MHTTEQLAAMKRTELQAAAVATFGKTAAAWTGPATSRRRGPWGLLRNGGRCRDLD